MTLHMTPKEYRALRGEDTPRKKAKRPRSTPVNVDCGVCHTAIKYAGNPNRGPSWGMVLIGGQLVPVHLECYYMRISTDGN